MSVIELRGVSHTYVSSPVGPADYALSPLDITWRDGAAYALLGPSGCGKTTLLNIISGLITPTRGCVLFGGVDVTRSSPQKRNIAQVFQFPVVYDTMTIFDNLVFPLKNRGVSPHERRARVTEVARMLDLDGDLARPASGLSAETKQRISLGRGLVRKDVAAVLLDEPLTVIDPQLKWLLRRKLRQVQEQLEITLVYVTHDQEEALTMADEVVVMDGGRIVQVGTPQQLFEYPARPFVGHFIGSPGMNFLPCRLTSGRAVLPDSTDIPLGSFVPACLADGASLLLGIRPEFVRIVPRATPGALSARVEEVSDRGSHRLATARLGGRTVRVRVPENTPLPDSPTVHLLFPKEWIRLYENDRLVWPSCQDIAPAPPA